MTNFELRTDEGIRFVQVNDAIVDVYYGAHCTDAIDIYNYDTRSSHVTSESEFRAVVEAYLSDPETDSESHWDAAFRATVAEGMA